MTGQACRVCGCTDVFGCIERCHWVEPDLCSVCSGATPRDRRRHYTRTASAVDPALDVPAGCLAIVSPGGLVRAMARCVADAQWVARALDYYQFAINDKAWRDLRARVWQRGPIARRPRQPLIIG